MSYNIKAPLISTGYYVLRGLNSFLSSNTNLFLALFFLFVVLLDSVDRKKVEPQPEENFATCNTMGTYVRITSPS